MRGTCGEDWNSMTYEYDEVFQGQTVILIF